ncbi:MAG: glycoside hydrolase 5 family protein [Fimbriimonadaceae bacterium]
MTCLIAALMLAKGPTAWYGPVTVTVAVPYTGDPYDPDDNDVDVVFAGPHGTKLTRLAYFIGDGKFASTLVAPESGTYRATVMRNGHVVAKIPKPLSVTARLPHGFIGLRGRHFAWSDGVPYFPIGYDYAWRNGNGETVAQGMAKMGRSGCNWSRIWASQWDEKNPFWPAPGAKLLGRELWQGPLETWDGICAAAEKADVHFQFVLFHHGPYSTTTDSNWKDHPWNTANGGFLADPTDFFTNAEAKKRAKIWLRYAVARYASSPAIMAWEIFNEVQWVDAIKKHPERVGDVAAWHKEMIAYVKSLDPYHHLVTSSSSESLDSHVFDDVDYMQPHTYPSNVLAAIGGYRFKGKPGFFGEFGPPFGPAANYRKLVRDGIYGGMLAGDAGAGEYWFWDRVDRAGLVADYKAAREVIDQSGLLTHLGAKPMGVWASTPTRGPLTLAAGGGWENSTTHEFDLPNVSLADLKGWSPYFQSVNGGQKAWANPLVVKFTAHEAGALQLAVGQVSPNGGSLTVWVNDKQVFDQAYKPPTAPARGGFGARRPPVSIAYPAGQVVLRVENHGADWVRIDSITVPGQGATAFAHGLGERAWALLRVVGSDTSRVTVHGLSLANGAYRVTVFDAATGAKSTSQVAVRSGTVELADLPPDAVIDFTPSRKL